MRLACRCQSGSDFRRRAETGFPLDANRRAGVSEGEKFANAGGVRQHARRVRSPDVETTQLSPFPLELL
jgi:hypothetical protein